MWNGPIAIHFAHRVGALVVTALVLATIGHVLYHHRSRGELRRPSLLLALLVAIQMTLGALTVLSGKHYIINSLHVVTGRDGPRHVARADAARVPAAVCRTPGAAVYAGRSRAGRLRRTAASADVGRVREADPPTRRGHEAAAQAQRRMDGRCAARVASPRGFHHARQAAAQPARPGDDGRGPVPGGAGRRAVRGSAAHARRHRARRRRRGRAEPGVGARHRRADAPDAAAPGRERTAARRPKAAWFGLALSAAGLVELAARRQRHLGGRCRIHARQLRAGVHAAQAAYVARDAGRRRTRRAAGR